MTGKADFTEDEWTRLKRAPFVAGMAITLADPGGPLRFPTVTYDESPAGVVELADTPALGAGAARRGGSSPSARIQVQSVTTIRNSPRSSAAGRR